MRVSAVAAPRRSDELKVMNPDHHQNASSDGRLEGRGLPRPAASRATPAWGDELHVCALCAGTLVHPVDWAAEGPSHWRVMMRCPDCEAIREGVFAQRAVDRLADELDRGSAVLIRELDRLTRENMAGEIEVLIHALEHDLIVPSDF